MNMMMQQQAMGNMGFGRGRPNQGMPNIGLLMGNQPGPKREYDDKLCLYVGNLTPTTLDNDLFKFFKGKGY
jgi:hypothetical protein